MRLNVQLAPETESRLNEVTIRDELKRIGISQMAAIRKQVDQPVRARLGGSPEGLTQAELLHRYLLSKEMPLDRREELMEAADRIFEGKAGD